MNVNGFLLENGIKQSIRKKAEDRTKYKTYLEINPSLDTPTVYEKIYGKKDISMMAKLRTSSHNLKIEMGRRTKTARNERLCHCGEVEDEEHFVLKCVRYSELRSEYAIKNNNKSTADILNNSSNVNYIKELYKRRKEVDI